MTARRFDTNCCSPHCSTEHVEEDVNAMADLCNSELTAIVARLLPLRTTSRRTRPNDAVDASNAVRAGRQTIGSRGNPNYAPIAPSRWQEARRILEGADHGTAIHPKENMVVNRQAVWSRSIIKQR